jgi:hypothetical protein
MEAQKVMVLVFAAISLRYFCPYRDLPLLRRFMVESLTLSFRGVLLESSGLRFSSGRSMNIRLFLKIYR